MAAGRVDAGPRQECLRSKSPAFERRRGAEGEAGESDLGWVAILERLKSVDPDERDSRLSWTLSWSLREVRTEAVARGLVPLIRSRNTQIRMDAISTAAGFPHPLLGAALAAQLEDKAATGWSGGEAERPTPPPPK